MQLLTRHHRRYLLHQLSMLALGATIFLMAMAPHLGNHGSVSSLLHITSEDNEKRNVKTRNEQLNVVNKVKDPTHPTSNKNQTKHPISKDCSCYNSNATKECCFRLTTTAHKFGTILIERMARKGFCQENNKHGNNNLLVASDWSIRLANLHPPSQDSRQVMMTRNWFDALVSGYLYHRSGRECWLNPYGRPWKQERNLPWDKKLISDPITHPFAPRNGRSICRYIVEESEEDGMQAYMDWGLSTFYKEVEEYWVQGQQNVTQDGEPRVMRICYENLVNPSTAENTFNQMADFLFPGGHEYKYPPPKSTAASHSTSKDPDLRNRLGNLARRLDQDVFGGIVLKRQELFGCHSQQKDH